MSDFRYYMPTRLYIGQNAVSHHGGSMAALGQKAMIITGRNSAKRNGSLEDCIAVLQKHGVAYILFDEVEENPSVETVERAAQIGREAGADFCIGIGGGSPMDAAKTIGILLKHRDKTGADLLAPSPALDSVPLAAIPTTAGTGSETTPYAILTISAKNTKQSLPHELFYDVAFLDAGYMLHMPRAVTSSTAIDALTHLIESYLCRKANFMSDKLCEAGFAMFAQCRDALREFQLDFALREKLLLMSALGGLCIAQTGTSLPHGMGYALTMRKNAPHGAANGVLTAAYLRRCQPEKVAEMLSLSGFASVDALDAYIKAAIPLNYRLTEDEIALYADIMMENTAKLAAHPYPVTREDIADMYRESFAG